MKLIAEYLETDLEVIQEARKDGSKGYVIEGVFMQANRENRNKRTYDKTVLESAVNKYVKEQVKSSYDIELKEEIIFIGEFLD